MSKRHHDRHHDRNGNTLTQQNTLAAGDDGDNANKGMVDRPLIPWGVNLASWLSLEDYFFVGDRGALQVATDWGHTAAQCFPPLYGNRTWRSETDLLVGLAADTSVVDAIHAFSAYRNSFIDLHADLPRIAAVEY